MTLNSIWRSITKKVRFLLFSIFPSISKYTGCKAFEYVCFDRQKFEIDVDMFMLKSYLLNTEDMKNK
jgi:hypothetical protein